LADTQGRLELPVRIQGVVPKTMISPDLQYAASRVAINKASEVVGDLLKKAIG
jgi:hypothetical protein